jgi:glycosyltransferase involved in cell wall biosynthesis
MSVAFVAPSAHVASELWLERMIEQLEPWIVAIATCMPAEPLWRGRIPSVTLAPGWRRAFAKLPIPIDLPFAVTADLRRLVDQPEVAVVLCHYVDFALRCQTAWEKSAKPVFVHCHGMDVTWDFRGGRLIKRRLHPKDYIQRVCRLAERVTLIANSEFTRSRLVQAGIPGKRIVVKYFGVPVPDQPGDRARDSEEVNILYLGRLVDFKGPEQTIEAFELACRRGLRGTLTLAGGGPLARACAARRRRSPYGDRIKLVGAVNASQGDSLREEADVFTAHNRLGPASRQEEAFGVSIVEAMAASLPVVTGRSGGVRETVVDGQTGILFEPSDVEAHAEALLQLAGQPKFRKALGTAGWHRARKLFSPEQERARLCEILGLNEKR